jgi:selenocysteine lyase/cysteine desulfurase
MNEPMTDTPRRLSEPGPEWSEIKLVGDGLAAPCVDGTDRPYLSLDSAASTPALAGVAKKVAQFLPMYSSIHRGAGYKSQQATAAYEAARESMLRFAGRADGDTAIFCRNTTEAINLLAYRLRLEPADVVLTTVVEHHANLLPWGRVATRRYVECGRDGTFDVGDVVAGLNRTPRPKLLTITGASNVTGWLPPVAGIIEAAHERGIMVAVDAAQLAPHRPLPRQADFVAFSGHKMYAPFGSGVLIGPRAAFTEGDPFLAGGGAVDLVDLDEVVWTEPPEREEAGSPNVVGAVALAGAVDELERLGWEAIASHEQDIARRLRQVVAALPGVTLLGPTSATEALPVVSFNVEGVPPALIAARLSAEFAIGVRHGCFCAHPYLIRLLDLSSDAVSKYRSEVLQGDRRSMPGAVRVSACISTTTADVERLAEALQLILSGAPAPVEYAQDRYTGDFHPATGWMVDWADGSRGLGAGCARG